MDKLDLLLRDVRRAECTIISTEERSALSTARDLLERCRQLAPEVEARGQVADLVRNTLALVHDARPTVRLRPVWLPADWSYGER